MKFNNWFAVLVTSLIFTFLLLGAVLGWEGKIADLAAGAFISGFTMILTFYFRKKPSEKDK